MIKIPEREKWVKSQCKLNVSINVVNVFLIEEKEIKSQSPFIKYFLYLVPETSENMKILQTYGRTNRRFRRSKKKPENFYAV